MEGKNYGKYHFTIGDWAFFFARAGVKLLLLGYLFYDSYKAVVFLLPLLIVDYRTMYKNRLERQKDALTIQFQSMMESLVTSLNAGYSLEYAFRDARKDLSLIYEKDAYIFAELDAIIEGLRMNVPLEVLLKDFAGRSHIEDIENFANVVAVAKKSGGNLIRIIQKTVRSITDKIAVEKEIDTIIAAKKLEERIMMLMPYGILFYFRLSNGDFLSVLYHNAIGIFAMTVFLILTYAADVWARRIMEIRV